MLALEYRTFFREEGDPVGYESVVSPFIDVGIAYIATIDDDLTLSNRQVSFVRGEEFDPSPNTIRGRVYLRDGWPIDGSITYGTIPEVKGDAIFQLLARMQWFVIGTTTAYVLRRDHRALLCLPSFPEWLLICHTDAESRDYERWFWEVCWESIVRSEHASGPLACHRPKV